MSTSFFSFPFLWYALAGAGLTIGPAARSADLVPLRSDWRYADDGVNRYQTAPPFFAPAFDDAAWKTGAARLGYGADGETTTVSFGPNASNRYPVTWFRKSFVWDGVTPPGTEILMLEYTRDDAAVIYINGVEVDRSNLPSGTLTGTTRASATVQNNNEIRLFQKALDPSVLNAGTNVVAVAVHQADASSSDLGFDLRLGFARRQLFFGQSVKIPAGQTYTSCDLIDVNADGSPDLFMGAFTSVIGRLELRLNDGRGNFGSPTVLDPAIAPVDSTRAINLNGDARPDLLVRPDSTGLYGYLNLGGGAFGAPIQASVSGSFLGLAVGDMDADGLDDYAALRSNNGGVELGWNRNTGAGVFSPTATVLQSFSSPFFPADIALIDANGDGRRDVLLSAGTLGEVRLYTQQAGAGATVFTLSTLATGIVQVRNLAVADIDGDGDQDFTVVSRPSTTAGAEGFLHTFINNGAGGFTRQPVPLPVDSGFVPQKLRDLDGDGDADLVFPASDAGLMVVYENDGNGQWVHRRAYPFTLQTFKDDTLAIGDVDMDGRLDLMNTSRTGEPVAWFRSIGNNVPRINTFAATPGTLTTPGATTLSWTVENATEVTVSPPGITLPATEGTGNTTVTAGDTTIYTLTARNAYGQSTSQATAFVADLRFTAPVAGPEAHYRESGGALIDIDGDGLKDLIYTYGNSVNRPNPSVRWAPLRADGTFGTPQTILSNITLMPAVVTDLNGDGLEDVLSGAVRNISWAPRQAGGFGAARSVTQTGSQTDYRSFAAGDADGDGDQDVFVYSLVPGVAFEIRIFLNDGAGNFTPGGSVPLPASSSVNTIQAADLDGDRFTELILNQSGGKAPYISWNRAGRLAVPVLTPLRENWWIEGIHFADVTGDGFTDFLTVQGSLSNRGVLITLETGRGDQLLGTRESVTAVTRTTAAFLALNSGDLNGDGDLDLVICQDNDPGIPAITYALNDGKGVFSAPVALANSLPNTSESGNPLLADLEGDGDLDVVAFFGASWSPAGVMFNNGVPLPVVKITTAARAVAAEAGSAAPITVEFSGVRASMEFTIKIGPGATAGPQDLLLGPTSLVTPVPGMPGEWKMTLPPGSGRYSLQATAVNDIQTEAEESASLLFSTPGAVEYADGTSSAAVFIPQNDFVVTSAAESGEGSLSQALANAHSLAGTAALIEISFSGTGGVPFLTQPVTLKVTGSQVGTLSPLRLLGPPPPGRVTLDLAPDTMIDLSPPPGETRTVIDNIDVIRSQNTPGAGAAFSVNSTAPVWFRRMNLSNPTGTGIRVILGNIRMESSTIAGCTETGLKFDAGTAVLVNCTISGNSASTGGTGGILHRSGDLRLIHCTVTGNTAVRDTSGPANGGAGLGTLANPSTVQLWNTLIAGNLRPGGGPDDVFGSFTSLGHNLIGNPDGSTGLVHGVNGDLTGTAATPLDPRLGPLSFHGGVTRIHLLLSPTKASRSPAINAGDNAVLTAATLGEPPWLDQRESPRQYPAITGTVDIGAYELQNTPPYLTGPGGNGLGPLTVREDAPPVTLALNGFFEDADGNTDTLSYEITDSTNPALLTTGLTGGADLVLTFARNTTGTAEVTVKAADLAGLTVTSTLRVTVEPAINPGVEGKRLAEFITAGTGPQEIFEFMLQNRGPSDAGSLVIQIEPDFPAFATLTDARVTRGSWDPATLRWTLDLPENGTALLVLSAAAGPAARGGTDVLKVRASVLESTPARIEPLADDTAFLAASLISAVEILALPSAGPALSSQTGLITQKVRFTNGNPLPVAALRIYVRGLPQGTRLYNAAGTDESGSWVDLPGPWAPGAFVDVSFEFYSPTRQTRIDPQYDVRLLRELTAPPGSNGPALAVSRLLPLAGGSMLLEWPAVPGRRYEVQYSSDLQNWRAAIPPVPATANRVQWIDSGAPKTLSSPGAAGMRYYRVRELPAGG